MEKTCKNCKWWERLPKPDADGFYKKIEHMHVSDQTKKPGMCLKTESAATEATKTSLAAACDASWCWSILATDENFGCVQWELRPEENPQ